MIEAGFVLTNLAALGWGGLLYRDPTGRPIWERLGMAASVSRIDGRLALGGEYWVP